MEQHERLRRFNRWRRGDKRLKQPDPKALGELIDAAADRLEVLEREHAEFFERRHQERRNREDLERLRDCAGRVIAAFEALGRTSDHAELLTKKSRCESVMLELQHVIATNGKAQSRDVRPQVKHTRPTAPGVPHIPQPQPETRR